MASETVIPDGQLMDEATKAEVMRRARIIAEVSRWLVSRWLVSRGIEACMYTIIVI